MFGPAKKASYTLYQADPTVSPLYTANITAKSPVTGENYQITCQNSSDLAGVACRIPDDNMCSLFSPRMPATGRSA